MSQLLAERDKKYVWHPFTQVQTEPEPIEIVKAEGVVLYAADGKEYIDCNSSWWVNVHGHGNERIREAVSEQFKKIDHIIFAGFTHEKGVELAERVANLLPEPLEKVFFSDNGSTAVEVAVKMAFQYWFNLGKPKKRVMALDGAYHGDTFGAMAVGERGVFTEPFEPFFFHVDFLKFPKKEREEAVLEQAETWFKTGEFAALIVEPLVQGSAGMRIYSVDFLEKLTRMAQKYEALVIFDEVMTGWGRTGKMFALDYCSVVPDLVCLSKGLTGGVLPLGLTVATNQLFDAFLGEKKSQGMLHGHSFTGNPLACAAACATLDIFEEKSTWDNIHRIEKRHAAFLEKVKTHKAIKNVRMLGTILVLETDNGEYSSYFSAVREKAYNYFIEHGLLIRPLGNTIFINAPYCITDEQLDYVYSAIEGFLGEIRQ